MFFWDHRDFFSRIVQEMADRVYCTSLVVVRAEAVCKHY